MFRCLETREFGATILEYICSQISPATSRDGGSTLSDYGDHESPIVLANEAEEHSAAFFWTSRAENIHPTNVEMKTRLPPTQGIRRGKTPAILGIHCDEQGYQVCQEIDPNTAAILLAGPPSSQCEG